MVNLTRAKDAAKAIAARKIAIENNCGGVASRLRWQTEP
jgi:hypothetical protein